MAVSGEVVREPIANPRDTEVIVIRQYVFANLAKDVRSPVNDFSTFAKIKPNNVSRGISANAFAMRYCKLE
jgi:hypothetical protein